jgi:hypothetical protein
MIMTAATIDTPKVRQVKATAWAAAVAVLTEQGPDGLRLPVIHKILETHGLTPNGAYSLALEHRAAGDLIAVKDAKLLSDRVYCIAIALAPRGADGVPLVKGQWVQDTKSGRTGTITHIVRGRTQDRYGVEYREDGTGADRSAIFAHIIQVRRAPFEA